MAVPTSPDTARHTHHLETVTQRALEGVAKGLTVAAREIGGLAYRVGHSDDTDDSDIDYITPAEGWKILDRAAQRHMDMSAEEFIKRWDSGEFEDVDEPSVMRVAMLLPLGR